MFVGVILLDFSAAMSLCVYIFEFHVFIIMSVFKLCMILIFCDMVLKGRRIPFSHSFRHSSAMAPMLPIAAMAPMLPIAKKTKTYEGSNQGLLTIVAELAAGAFGAVTKCTSHAGTKTCAVKRVCNGPRGAVGELLALHEGLYHSNLLHIEEAFKSGKGEFCLRMGFTAGQELFDLAEHCRVETLWLLPATSETPFATCTCASAP